MAYTKVGKIRPSSKGAWNAYAAYEVLDVVMNASGETAYMAVQNVPAGTVLTNTDYWKPIIDVSAVVSAANAAAASATSTAEAAAALTNEAAATIADKVDIAAVAEPFTVSGNPVHCHPATGCALNVAVEVSAVQGGSGAASPTNIRPITLNPIQFTHCGKNLFDADTVEPVKHIGASSGTVYSRYGHSFPGGTTYTISGVNRSPSILYYIVLDGAENAVSGKAGYVTHGGNSGTIGARDVVTVSVDEGTTLNVYELNTESESTAKTYFQTSLPQVEIGTVATAYAAHESAAHSLSLPDGFGAGLVNLTQGSAALRRRIVKVSELTWSKDAVSYPGGNYFTAVLSPTSVGHTAETDTGMSSHFAYGAAGAANVVPSNSYWINGGGDGIRIVTPEAASVSELTSKFNDAQFCYTLASPQQVSFAAESIAAFEGTNTLSSEGEELNVSGYESPVYSRKRLEDRIAALEAAVTE